MDAQVIDVDDEHLVGSYNALLVLMWGDRTLADKVARVIEQAKAFAVGRPQIAVIVVIEDGSAIPDKAARKQLETLAEVLLPTTIALVYVYEGTGLRASASRTLMTALTLVGAPSARQHKVVRTIDQGMDWLVPILAGAEFGNEAERRRAVHDLQQYFIDYRAKLAARA